MLDPVFAYNAGLEALDKGHEERVLPTVRAAVAAYPTQARLHQVEGLIHRNLDDLGSAVQSFSAAARFSPSDARIALGYAHATLEAGLPAVSLFEKALVLSSDKRSVWPGLAAAVLQENNVASAAERVAIFLASDPAWVDGYWLLARYRWMLGERENSVAPLRAVIAQHPRELILWRQLILILTHAYCYDEALTVVREARRALGNTPALDLSEAICLAELGEIAAADAAFARLDPPSTPELAVSRLRLDLRADRPRSAANLAEKFVNAPGGNLVAPYLATAWRILGDPRWQWLEGDPRLIGSYDLGEKIAELPRLVEVLRRLHREGGQPLEQSVRGGTQTDGPLLSRVEPEIRALRAALIEAINTHIAQLPPRDATHPFLKHRAEGTIRFTNSWSIRLAGSGFHTRHVHPRGWLSSAFYVVVPDRHDPGEPHAGWLTFGQPPAELGLNLPPVRSIQPEPGRLVLFPSTMWHGTEPFIAGERMTVAFDVAPPHR